MLVRCRLDHARGSGLLRQLRRRLRCERALLAPARHAHSPHRARGVAGGDAAATHADEARAARRKAVVRCRLDPIRVVRRSRLCRGVRPRLDLGPTIFGRSGFVCHALVGFPRGSSVDGVFGTLGCGTWNTGRPRQAGDEHRPESVRVCDGSCAGHLGSFSPTPVARTTPSAANAMQRVAGTNGCSHCEVCRRGMWQRQPSGEGSMPLARPSPSRSMSAGIGPQSNRVPATMPSGVSSPESRSRRCTSDGSPAP